MSHFDPFAPANLNGTQLFDHDLDNFEDKPWRKPGADLTDYFNFGFNEVTWRAYCVKQKALREEFGLQKKIGVYDSGAAMGSGVAMTGSNTSLPNTRQLRRPPGDSRPYNQQQQQDYRGYSNHHETRDTRDTREIRDTREYRDSFTRSRSRHDSPSPPPPPPPPSSSRHVSSRSRSRSPERRHVSRSSRYEDAPRSPPR